MSKEHQFGSISTIAALLVVIFSVIAARRDEGDIAQAYEFSALPMAVILLLVIAFVVFFVGIPLAELSDRPAKWGIGLGVVSLLLVALPILAGSRISLDWGFCSGVSIVVGAGGVLWGEEGRKRSAGRVLSYGAIVLGVLAIFTDFVVFALDVLII